MTKSVSLQKRQANRRNALRSTGPKSLLGKQRSSGNSLGHGLSTPVVPNFHHPLVASIIEMIAQDAVDSQAANALAGKILEYERNLAYQRELFAQDLSMGLSFQRPSAAEEEEGVRGLFGAEIDMFDDYLDWEKFHKRPIPDKDLKFVLNSKLKMQKLWLRMHKRTQRDKLKRAVKALRYLQRSSNQLIKTLKALRSS
jgi:hypothetical protein